MYWIQKEIFSSCVSESKIIRPEKIPNLSTCMRHAAHFFRRSPRQLPKRNILREAILAQESER